jgi:hypothetical protein
MALRQAGWILETMDERYGKTSSQDIQDTQWIEEASLVGDVLLCKDLAIAHNPLEAQVVYMTSARVFALSNASLAGPAMAQWYGEDRGSGCQGKRPIRHVREPVIWSATDQARLHAGLKWPARMRQPAATDQRHPH